MDFATLLMRFTAAVEAGDGSALGAVFTEDGVYHDTFYGEFQGRAAIKDMLENYFWRDAEAFRWDMHDPVATTDKGYARWVFSYTSKLPEAAGKRCVFEGMSLFRLENGLIRHYGEVFDQGIALVQTAFPPERIARIVGRSAERLRTRVAGSRHLT